MTPKLIDLSPLFRGATAEAIRIAGLALGEPASKVDRAQITGAEDDAPGEARAYTKGSVFRRGADGELVEIPLAERIDGTLSRGGFLRAGEVAIRVDNGRVDAIFVRGPALASLGIAVEADIERRFGAAAGVGRDTGTREFHFPEQRVVVAWDRKAASIEHLALRDATWHEPRLGARDLLAQLLDHSGRLMEDAPEEPSGHPYLRVLHQRAMALIRALELGSIADVVRGSFLEGPPSPERLHVLAEIAAVGPSRGKPSHHAPMVFVHLLHYRRDVERIVNATAGWLECSDSALLGMLVTQSRLGRAITELMVDVDRWLCALLDPLERTFELRTLIAKHGWPDVELYELEHDDY